MDRLSKTEMIDNDEGLKDREETLNELRSLFRYEEQLLSGGWYSKADFVKEAYQLILKLADLLKQDE